MLWVLRYWRPIAAVASVVAVLAGAWAWRQSVYREGEAAGRAACEARYTAALEAATAAQARKDAEYRAGLADREAALRDALARLSAPPPPPRVLVREVPAVDGRCERRSDDFWRLYNDAAGAGGAAGPSAAGALSAPAPDHAAMQAP